MKEDIIRKACLQLMENTEAVYVSTIDGNGFPQTRVMYNMLNVNRFARLYDYFHVDKDNPAIYLTTNRPSVKMEQIKNNPKACFYYCSLDEMHGLAIMGEIQIIEDKEIRHKLWQDDWVQYYEDGVDGLEYVVIKFNPSLAKGWYKGEKFEFEFKEQ